MTMESYKQLAERLDALPNGFPPTENGVELRLLATLYSPEEAALAAQLRVTLETPDEIAQRIDGEAKSIKKMLKSMSRRGLIRASRQDKSLVFGLMPFVVGIYEMQMGKIEPEFAQLFEDYYFKAFGEMLAVKPQVHRVIPVRESVQADIEVQPYESVATMLDKAQSWGVIDCVCRKQKELIGDGCDHPIDVCMVLHKRPNAYDEHPDIQALTYEEAQATLTRAADAGLVHTVGNNKFGTHYICNCCTCSCGILRGMADLGMANVVARSAFVNQVDSEFCNGCETCVDHCQFDALALNDAFVMQVDNVKCVGCGVCVGFCEEEAMQLVRRPEDEVKAPPETLMHWGMERAMARNLDVSKIL